MAAARPRMPPPWTAGDLAGGEAIEGGDLGGERAERGGLDVFLAGLLLKAGVVFLERVMILTELVEARSLDEHPRVGTGEAGDGEHADSGRGYEDVDVAQGQGHLVDGSVLIPADEEDVKASFGTQDQACALSFVSLGRQKRPDLRSIERREG